jgi:hypothetical protein
MFEKPSERNEDNNGYSEYGVGVRPKRSGRVILQLPRVFTPKRTEVLQVHASRFPTIIGDQSVSYDSTSQLFTITGLHESIGASFYFADLPRHIQKTIQKMKSPHQKNNI